MYDLISYKDFKAHDIFGWIRGCSECLEPFNRDSVIWNLEESNHFLCDSCHKELPYT